MRIQCHPSGEEMVSGNAALANAALLGMALLCGFEMLFLIWIRFRRRSGLYFWSLTLATVAELMVNISNVLYYWVLKDSCGGIVSMISIPGAFFFVFFEYFVLYSRLRLVQTSERTLRYLLGIIYIEAILVELPLAIMVTAVTISPSSSSIGSIYHTIWRLEAVLYMVVDTILSSTYIFQIKRIWSKDSGPEVRSILREIVAMTCVVIGIDVVNAVLVLAIPSSPLVYAIEVGH
jgi:hypothetical protein